MIDISAQLRGFADMLPRWSEERSREILETVRRLFNGSVEWDEDAGEDWAIVLSQQGVNIYVSMRGPLVLLTHDILDMVRRSVEGNVMIVSVAAMDEPELTAEEGSLSAAFGDRAQSDALTPCGFSARDLWFATV